MTQATTSSLPPLADPETLSVWLGVPPEDRQLQTALQAASDRFRGAVRHPVSLVKQDRVELDGNGTAAVLLPAAPVVEVHTVQLDGNEITDRCSISRDGRLRRRGKLFPDRLGCLQVTYTHGYEPVPDDIAEVVIDQARAMHSMRPGVSQVQTAAESVSFGQASTVGVTAQWSNVVAAYRLNRGDRA